MATKKNLPPPSLNFLKFSSLFFCSHSQEPILNRKENKDIFPLTTSRSHFLLVFFLFPVFLLFHPFSSFFPIPQFLPLNSSLFLFFFKSFPRIYIHVNLFIICIRKGVSFYILKGSHSKRNYIIEPCQKKQTTEFLSILSRLRCEAKKYIQRNWASYGQSVLNY